MKYSVNILLIIIFIALPFGKSNAQSDIQEEKLKDLEGTWIYRDERIDFEVILRNKKINETPEKPFLFGFIKLVVNGHQVYNNLEFVEFLESKGSFDFYEIFDGRGDRKKIPTVIFSSDDNGISGSFQILDKVKAIHINVKVNENELIWNFKRFVTPVNEVDQDHIPAVPSTWVLQRVEE
ncbi:DUF6705 family protein [Mongoliitalea lutea]|uniref:DUF6705 domain-containing protein n=1 Tax=Mongoliitalea lutea TaxID=849756 RepID=A0A8J3CVY1_9BACT|nr:DUF6705 family protein [Mongoliitalea lutea]GHB33183.1 hypothetical protein GCM10008106_12640 [Mongoliitalea lutea]